MITIQLRESEAQIVAEALLEYTLRLRNAKRRPQGVSVGELSDRIVACSEHARKLTQAGIDAAEPRPSRGDL